MSKSTQIVMHERLPSAIATFSNIPSGLYSLPWIPQAPWLDLSVTIQS